MQLLVGAPQGCNPQELAGARAAVASPPAVQGGAEAVGAVWGDSSKPMARLRFLVRNWSGMLFSIFQNNVVFDFVDAAATTFPLTLVMGAGSKINLGQIWISPPKNICVPPLIPAH